MFAGRDPTLDALARLLDGGHLAMPDDLADVVLAAGGSLDWEVVVYVVDYHQRTLVPLLPAGAPPRPVEDVESTLAGRAFRSIEPVAAPSEARTWVPLVDGVDRLGVLSIDHRGDVDLGDDPWRERVRWFSHLVGHLLSVKSNYGDGIHRARASTRRSVPSELIWSLLPPQTVATPGVVISGILEPADRVAGDVFDYSLCDGIADVGIIDATGHDLRSGIIGAIALSAYRNSRRRGDDLSGCASAIDAVLADLELDTLASGVFGKLDIATGRFRYVIAGHPSPLLLRNAKVVRELDAGRRILLGLRRPDVEPGEEQLEPGDIIVLYTDGVIEARDVQRNFFGLERFIDILERSAASGQPPPEILRRAVRAVLEHQREVLQDDATILMVQWAAGTEHELHAD